MKFTGLQNQAEVEFRCWWQGGSGHTQFCRKETPPLQHAAGPAEPSGGGDVINGMFPYPAYLTKSKPVTQFPSRIPTIHLRPPPTCSTCKLTPGTH